MMIINDCINLCIWVLYPSKEMGRHYHFCAIIFGSMAIEHNFQLSPGIKWVVIAYDLLLWHGE